MSNNTNDSKLKYKDNKENYETDGLTYYLNKKYIYITTHNVEIFNFYLSTSMHFNGWHCRLVCRKLWLMLMMGHWIVKEK